MFAKLFSRITESSLMEEPIEVRYTFVMMLAICDPTGEVIGTDVAIARRLNMPLNDFLRCISELGKPDANSNSQVLNGVRICKTDGERGYRVVNFLTYRNIKDATEKREYMRQYMREYRENQKKVKPVNSRKPALTKVTQAEATATATEESTKKVASLPVFIFPENLQTEAFYTAWKQWLDYLLQRKKKPTETTMTAQLKKLSGMGESKARQAIENSIVCGWQGLFEPKEALTSLISQRNLQDQQPGESWKQYERRVLSEVV